MSIVRLILIFLVVGSLASAADAPATGSISGTVLDPKSGHAVQFVTVALKRRADAAVVMRTATDAHGAFDFERVAAGEYTVDYAPVGGDNLSAGPVNVTPEHRHVDLGRLELHPASPLTLEKMEVSARREAFYNSIDRKVYAVGKDVQSATGSASNLLQNIPSVQVDIEGNVSLRGNDNVLILIDGKPSNLMSTTNRADVLEQMPADSIERIEVITNPSAKYKPDGTAGIINLVMKRKHDAGVSGTVRANVGNDSRSNAGLTLNYNPGKYNVYTTVSVRQDDRVRYAQDNRTHVDAATNSVIATQQYSREHMRPLSRLAEIGGDYAIDDNNKIGGSLAYNYRTFFRTSTVSNLSQSATGATTMDYNRDRTDPEWQKTVEVNARYQHSFAEPDHALDTELKHERHQELEDNHYTNTYFVPSQPLTRDYERMNPTETNTTLTSDYTRPLADDGKLEAGYSGETNDDDTDFRSGDFDPVQNAWTVDTARTNRFIYKDWIHALYATFGRPAGQFGFMAGLRLERTTVHTNQATIGLTDAIEYYRLHPTLHLTYNLTDTSQLQLNYSHRVHRPESDDLNPFPEYQDPYNLREGNPKLRPEETHSIEAGYQYRKADTTYLAALYYRDTYHAFTTVTRYIDAVTLLTTHENLASNRSGGLELVATTPIGSHLSINASGNAYYSEIDASNLGYSANRSAIAWDAKFNADWRVRPADLVKINANYTAKRLTAQGDRMPTYVVNLGYRHELNSKNLSFVLTVSDLFNSLKERTVIDTPVLHDDITRRRSSRIVYAGFVYTFGHSAKKKKDDSLQFDNQL